MTRTPTHPPDDPRMWLRLLSRTHPEAGGSHELFIWTGAVRDVVCNLSLRASVTSEPEDNPSRRRDPSTDDKPRVPYPPGTDFEECTRTALKFASLHWREPHGRVLSLLADCAPLKDLAHEQERGASYKRLAAIAHTYGMSKAERIRLYSVAKDIPLSDRHAGHILARLKRRAGEGVPS